MPCYKPIDAWYSNFLNPSGKPRLTFTPTKAENPKERIELPCGRCIGCRLDKSKEWALRCYHESQMHQENIFLTLTYDDYHIPEHESLDKTHFQKFIRALRQSSKQKIRFYMCGEYGDETNRPHYHALLFGYDFKDKLVWRHDENTRIYRSAELEKHWDHGNSEIGACTFQSAGYIARYILKKLNGQRAKSHYGKREPEYIAMSNHPGIGKSWYKEYKNDIFPSDFCVTPNGRQMQVPQYYRNLLALEDPELYEKLRALRIEKAKDNPNNTEQRRKDGLIIQTQKAERLKRDFL